MIFYCVIGQSLVLSLNQFPTKKLPTSQLKLNKKIVNAWFGLPHIISSAHEYINMIYVLDLYFMLKFNDHNLKMQREIFLRSVKLRCKIKISMNFGSFINSSIIINLDWMITPFPICHMQVNCYVQTSNEIILQWSNFIQILGTNYSGSAIMVFYDRIIYCSESLIPIMVGFARILYGHVTIQFVYYFLFICHKLKCKWNEFFLLVMLNTKKPYLRFPMHTHNFPFLLGFAMKFNTKSICRIYCSKIEFHYNFVWRHCPLEWRPDLAECVRESECIIFTRRFDFMFINTAHFN